MPVEPPAARVADRRSVTRIARPARAAALAVSAALAVAACTGDAGAPPAEPIATGATVTTTTDAGPVDSGPVDSGPVDTDPSDTDPSTVGVRPEGFSTVTVRITDANGEVCEVCMWLADSGAERGRGLMGVTDLGDAAGMVFVFDRVGQGAFFMYRTITPLSIAWFAADGSFVSSTDMAPCESDDPSACPRYAPAGGYDLAIEVFLGDLEALGIGPGSRAEVLAGTEAAQCDTPSA